jgi:hypothetical protein
MTRLRIKITPHGDLQFIYDDVLQPLTTLGTTSIQRASHVEPTTTGQWTADLNPIHGPLLGPFLTRTNALLAETDWLLENWLRQPATRQPNRSLLG